MQREQQKLQKEFRFCVAFQLIIQPLSFSFRPVGLE